MEAISSEEKKETMTILVLSPHTDDGELGCGGSIAKWIEAGEEVYYAFFSDCDTEGIIRECWAALGVLGMQSDRILGNYFERRIFPEKRQEILEKLIEIKEFLEPDLVVCPSLNDKHQDHQVVAEEARRAFNCSLICYEHPSNTPIFESRLFVELNESNIMKKLKALREYKSQYERPYMGNTMLHVARYNGLMCSCKYAEAFEVIRWII
jgi:LmbE family N-acetylglucosaminyl deacetylase